MPKIINIVPKFGYDASKLKTLPIQNGAFYVALDTDEIYVDMNNERHKLSQASLVVVDELSSVEEPIPEILYYEKTSKKLYFYDTTTKLVNEEEVPIGWTEAHDISDIETRLNNLENTKIPSIEEELSKKLPTFNGVEAYRQACLEDPTLLNIPCLVIEEETEEEETPETPSEEEPKEEGN